MANKFIANGFFPRFEKLSQGQVFHSMAKLDWREQRIKETELKVKKEEMELFVLMLAVDCHFLALCSNTASGSVGDN